MSKLPEAPDEFVLADAGIRQEVTTWIESNREAILQRAREERLGEAEKEDR